MVAAGEIPRPPGQHAAALTPSVVIAPYASTYLPGQLVMTDMDIAMLAEALDDFDEAPIETPASAASAGGAIVHGIGSLGPDLVTGGSGAPRSSFPSGALLLECATVRVAPRAASAEVGAGKGAAPRVASPVLNQPSVKPFLREVVGMQPAAAAGRCGAGWGGQPYPSPVPVLELRVDSADGQAYTFSEFMEEYGRTLEWELAVQVQALQLGARELCTVHAPAVAVGGGVGRYEKCSVSIFMASRRRRGPSGLYSQEATLRVGEWATP